MKFIKIILLILVFNYGTVFAAAGGGGSMAEVYEPRGPVTGYPGTQGVVFATKRDAEEALKRGAYDARNPFVECVGCITFKWAKDSPTATGTVVRIDDDVFLTTAHFLKELRERMSAGGEIDCRIHMGEKRLPVRNLNFAIHPDDDLGIFITKGCAEHAKPRAGYPTFAPVDLDLSKPRDGYVVSQTTLKFIDSDGKAKDLESSHHIHRTLSIIPNLLKEGKGIASLTTIGKSWVEGEALPLALRGMLEISDGVKTVEAVYEEICPQIKLSFPGTREKSNQRLYAQYGEGAYGSALFLKVEGKFVLVGMYTSAHLWPIMEETLSLVPSYISKSFRDDARLNISFKRKFVFLSEKVRRYLEANAKKYMDAMEHPVSSSETPK